MPLFVEELTKTILESGLLREVGERYALTGPLPPLAIPATVQDSLMARLDRLAPVKEVAQLGAVLGREFAYEVLAAVASLGEPALPEALEQLVGAGLLFRRGQPPEAHYRFKHALVQDAAYASLLKSTRQQLHTQHRHGAGGPLSCHRGDGARGAGPSLHGGGAPRTGHPLLAAGGRARDRSARRMSRPSAT